MECSRRALLVHPRRAARGERVAAGVGPVPEAARCARCSTSRSPRAGSTSGRSPAMTRASCSRLVSNPLRRIRSYPLLLEAPVAEAAHDRDHRLAHDLDRDALRLRAAGRRLVRAHRAQVGDAAHALHPRRRESGVVLRGEVRLGDLRAARQVRSTSAPWRAASPTSRIAPAAIALVRRALTTSSRRTASIGPTDDEKVARS